MDYRRFNSRHLNVVLVSMCVVTLAGLGCGGTTPRSSSGSGGASGGAGGNGSGGTGGVASGGVASGGAGGNASGGVGGNAQGGSGGASAPTSCAGNGDCSGASPLCETTLKQCAQCLKSSDCVPGGHCLGNQCVTYTTCNDSRDCKTDQVCDSKRGLCFQCLTAADCASGQACVNNACVAPACEASSDCGGKVCDTSTKRCVACVADGDCGSDGKRCIQNTCRASCTSDKQCTPDGKLCDTATSLCVLCRSNADCPASAYCEVGLCKPDVCDATQSMCSGDGVASCNSAGSGWGPVTACDASNPCKVVGGVASCGGLGRPDGGTTPLDGGTILDGGGTTPLDGRTTPIDGGATSVDGGFSSDVPIQPGCTTDKVMPCTGLPRFAGTQTIDGNGDDLCSVPSFTFTKAAAAKVNNYNNIPDSQFESIVARVAWSPAGLHAFFNVTDASVQSVNTVAADQALSRSYQGDSIEIYISSNDKLTGLTGTDNNSLHVVVPAAGPAVSVKTDSSGAGTPTALPAAQFKQAKTSAGYAIEVLLPWPGGTAASGSQVRFDLAFNSADADFGGVDDMRDAQVIYHVGIATPSTCGGAVEPFCDNRAWCATTLQP